MSRLGIVGYDYLNNGEATREDRDAPLKSFACQPPFVPSLLS
jgi:hypothetical protein